MTWNVRKFLLGTAISLAILLACFGLGLIPLNLFFLKTTITETVRDHTGVAVVVEGPLRLQLGWQPKLTAREIVVRWPDESHPLSASIRDLAIQTRMPSVWRGDVDLQSASAEGIVINQGADNFGEWLPEQLRLEAAAPLNEDMSLTLEGRIRGEDWAVSLNGASLGTLLQATKEYPLTVSLDLPGSGLDFNGALLLPWDSPRIAGQLDVQSADLSSLLIHLGQELPGLGQLSLHSGIELDESMVELDGLEASLDDFSFTLSALARDWSTRPWFKVSADVPVIDPASLPGMQKESVDSGSDTELNLQPLIDQVAGFDGQLELTVGQVHHADFPVKELAVSANLDKGLLTVSHATGSISGIDVSAKATLDTSVECTRLETSLWITEMDLSMLSDILENDTSLEGRLANSQLNTSSCGDFLRQHLQNLETDFEVEELMLSEADDQPPLEFRNIDVAVNWQKAGRISFESALMGEPLTLSASFGSVQQIATDELWPIALEARTDTAGLEFSGQTAFHESGLILDLTLAVRLGKSDISGELDWSGLSSGRPLKADLRSKLLDLEDLGMLFSDNEGDDSGSIQDWSEFLDDAELLEHWHEVPSVYVKLAVGQFKGTSFEIGNMGLDAHLEDRQLKDGHMQLNFEGVEMAGLLNVDMREPNTLFDYHVIMKNLDIGRLMKTMELSDTVNASVERADILFESQGVTPRELVQNAKIDSVLTSLQWSFEAGPKNRPFDMNLSEVKVTTVPGASTTWETEGTLNGFPLNAWLKTPNVRDAFDEKTPLPLRFIVGSRSDITMLDLVVYPETNEGLRSEIQLSGRYSNDEDVDLSTLPSPLEDYSFSTDLTLGKNEYLASDIEVRVGSSNATGTFSIQSSGQGYLFDLDAGSSFIETDDLVRWVQEFRETRDFMAAPETADPDEAAFSAGLLTVIDRYLKEFIGDNSWDVSVKIGELRSGGRLLGESEFNLHMDGLETVLDPVTIRLPGGDVAVRYTGIKTGSDWDYNLDVLIERLEYGGLLRLYDPAAVAEGVMYLDTTLHSRTQDPEGAVNHLEGTIDLAVFPENAGARFLDLWASNLIFALLPLGENQQKELNCMVARFEVENGVMTSKETFLDSTEIIVRARGEIDLANRQLDLLAAPQAKMEKFLSVSTPIEVTGPFDDFSVGVAKGGFVMTMIRWYYGLIYVPWKWLTGERFPADGIETCFRAMDWEIPTEAR
jgi:uncharacterized protein involved in outer membrane biogenesis